ncbi:hypothetical protein AB832_07695 [Flavobacteriaceae bacterium (ex Bugula neritina AB1)]|nr:hypothetical protein AB832_07695 [Flavobacteriaceae bacterium (ex Bugula neritina AB1)]
MNKAFEFALKHYGLEEIKGRKHEPIIIEAFKTVGHGWIKDDETAWCAAWMGYCLHKAGLEFLKTVRARDYEKYGKETKMPKIGDIAVFWRYKESSGYGHVGFYVSEDEHDIYVLGGNQSNEVRISKYPKSQLLGYREILKASVTDTFELQNIKKEQNEFLERLGILRKDKYTLDNEIAALIQEFTFKNK